MAQPPPYPVPGQQQPMPGYPQPQYPGYGMNEQGMYPPPAGPQYPMYPPPQPVAQQPMPYGGPPGAPGGGYSPYEGPPPNMGNYPPPQGYPAPQGVPSGPGGQENWMVAPTGVPNMAPGLAYLMQIDQLLVKQKVEMLEAFTGFETENKYTIKNNMGQKVYHAKEKSDCCSRNCCGPLRPFDLKIMDNMGQEVIHLNRPLACDSCWFPCCLQNMEVSAPPGNVIGYIEQEWSICSPKFVIRDANRDVVLKIDGPLCTFSICGDVEFKVLSKDSSTVVGKITKQWAGLLRESFTDSDYFGVTFPMDLDVNMKATMLGACFLIDFMFFEKSGNKERDSVGMW